MKDYLPENWFFDSIGDLSRIINNMGFEREITTAMSMRDKFISKNNRLELGENLMSSVLP